MAQPELKAPGRLEMQRPVSCLVVMAGPRFGESIPLKEGRNIVGCAPEADIYFTTGLLAERHFLLTCNRKQVTLQREGGATLLNNAPVERAELKDGDLIFAGGLSIRYVEEGSLIHFYLGDTFYGRERRQFPRFSMVSTAYAYLPVEDQKLEILAIRTIGRGGIGMFSLQNVSIGSRIQVVLYSKDAKETMVAESIIGTVVAAFPWKSSLFLVSVSFQKPVCESDQPNLHRYLAALERFF